MNISVVIPLYNKSEFIVRAVNSVLNQTVPPSEIIVVDDGSSDDSLDKLKNSFSDQVTIIHQSNLGVSCARNRGILSSKSSYIALLDADDYWYEDFLEKITNLHKLYPDAGVYSTSYQFSEDGVLTNMKNPFLPKKKGVINDYFIACCNADLPLTSSSVCIKKELLEKIGYFPEDISLGEDQIVWSKAACLSSLVYDSSICSVYDLDASSLSSAECNKITVSPHVKVLKNLISSGFIPKRFLCSISYFIHLSILSSVKSNIIRGNRVQALRLLLTETGLRWDLYRISAFIMILLPKKIAKSLFSFVKANR